MTKTLNVILDAPQPYGRASLYPNNKLPKDAIDEIAILKEQIICHFKSDGHDKVNVHFSGDKAIVLEAKNPQDNYNFSNWLKVFLSYDKYVALEFPDPILHDEVTSANMRIGYGIASNIKGFIEAGRTGDVFTIQLNDCTVWPLTYSQPIEKGHQSIIADQESWLFPLSREETKILNKELIKQLSDT